jgi:hypothetical protein
VWGVGLVVHCLSRHQPAAAAATCTPSAHTPLRQTSMCPLCLGRELTRRCQLIRRPVQPSPARPCCHQRPACWVVACVWCGGLVVGGWFGCALLEQASASSSAATCTPSAHTPLWQTSMCPLGLGRELTVHCQCYHAGRCNRHLHALTAPRDQPAGLLHACGVRVGCRGVIGCAAFQDTVTAAAAFHLHFLSTHAYVANQYVPSGSRQGADSPLSVLPRRPVHPSPACPDCPQRSACWVVACVRC